MQIEVIIILAFIVILLNRTSRSILRFACSPCCNLAACSVTHDSCMLCVTLAFVQLRLDETQAVLLDSLWWSYSTTRCVAAQIPTCADCTQQCRYWTRWLQP